MDAIPKPQLVIKFETLLCAVAIMLRQASEARRDNTKEWYPDDDGHIQCLEQYQFPYLYGRCLTEKIAPNLKLIPYK